MKRAAPSTSAASFSLPFEILPPLVFASSCPSLFPPHWWSLISYLYESGVHKEPPYPPHFSMNATEEQTKALAVASQKPADALIDEKAVGNEIEYGSKGPVYSMGLTAAEKELEKKLKRKIDARWLVLTLIYILNCMGSNYIFRFFLSRLMIIMMACRYRPQCYACSTVRLL